MNAAEPLLPLAEHIGSLGWQLVPTQWHRQNGRAGNTPITGVTGAAPFLAAGQIPRIAELDLHHEGGPDCVGRLAKPAVRPPLHVIGFDVDDGYAGKSGGDTLVEAEMLLGPLPATWTLTARGQWTPSRRRWYRIPADLVVMDAFFAPYGGNIETIRTGHRYSWTSPAIHTRKGQLVGPVLWYGPDQEVAQMPHTDQLPELPAPWVHAIREDAGKRALSGHQARTGLPSGAPAPVTEDYANAAVLKVTRKLHDMPPSGGGFRSAVFGLAANIARREVARGGTRQAALQQVAQAFAEHPHNLAMDADDLQWAEDGIDSGWSTPWAFTAPTFNDYGFAGLIGPNTVIVPPTAPAAPASEPATADEIVSFLSTYTRFTQPARLGRRTVWMREDPPTKLAWHARCLVGDVLAGLYPASRAAAALADSYQHHGGQDPCGAYDLLRDALGAVLDQKVSA